MSPIGVKKAQRDRNPCVSCGADKPIFQGSQNRGWCKVCVGAGDRAKIPAPPKEELPNITPNEERARNIRSLGERRDGEGPGSV